MTITRHFEATCRQGTVLMDIVYQTIMEHHEADTDPTGTGTL